jgi:hypothetical protein
MCDELYCRKLVLLVMNYIVHLNEYLYILPVLEAPEQGRQLKQTVVKKQNNYIRWLTDEYNGSCVSHGSPLGPNIIISLEDTFVDLISVSCSI